MFCGPSSALSGSWLSIHMLIQAPEPGRHHVDTRSASPSMPAACRSAHEGLPGSAVKQAHCRANARHAEAAED